MYCWTLGFWVFHSMRPDREFWVSSKRSRSDQLVPVLLWVQGLLGLPHSPGSPQSISLRILLEMALSVAVMWFTTWSTITFTP